MNIRENWRIALLVVFVVGATVTLFAPFAAPDTGANTTTVSDDPTNLQYGLELAGGTRVRAPLIGTTAEDLEIPRNDRASIRADVVSGMNVDSSDVNVRLNTENGDAIEVLTENVSEQRFATALTEAGLNATTENIRDGVTRTTLDQTAEVINAKINRGGLSGGQATVQTSATGQNYVVVDVPNVPLSEVLDIIGDRGIVRVVAEYPVQTDNGTEYRNETVLTSRQLERANIGVAQMTEQGPNVDATLTEEDAQEYQRALVEAGFTSSEGVSNCRVDSNPEDPGYCLHTVLDNETVYSAGMSPGLASLLDTGEFLDAPTFVMETRSLEEAQELQINLRAGALPAQLDIDEGTTLFLQQSLGDRFKSQALLTGIVAWLAVSGMVFLRYKNPRVAIPMLLTAMAEVYLLLGFAAAIGLPLNLSYIAGFIAVIGTGVDDLLIIADEILQEGTVATGRVFQNRFRKAFWVIGAAAVTTIIAMSPLAVLSLGDLTGFAIVTIVGVLIGVLITRPAYGDVLRNLVLDEQQRAQRE
mgnify:FL=1